jgi:hypothetical protein
VTSGCRYGVLDEDLRTGERDGSVPRFPDTAPIGDAERGTIAFRKRERLVAGIRR